MGWMVNATLRPFYRRKWPGGWVVQRASLNRCKKSRPDWYMNPGPSGQYQVTVPTALCRPVQPLNKPLSNTQIKERQFVNVKQECQTFNHGFRFRVVSAVNKEDMTTSKTYLQILEEISIWLQRCRLQNFYSSIGHSPATEEQGTQITSHGHHLVCVQIRRENVRIKQRLFWTSRYDVIKQGIMYEGWNFNSGNYLFTTDTK